ncbi:efflux RND transporter periplasmic adaptor subunit [Thermodesulfobacteriota bacterium B35]
MEAAPWALHTADVTNEPVELGFPALARVSTRAAVTVMARISGRILAMGPREGIHVHKGELLVRIDTREIRDRIRALRARLVAARAEKLRARDEFAREKKLFKGGGSSRSAVEARRTAFVTAGQQVTALEHEMGALEVQRSYGTITSPADGIIAERMAEPGDMAVPGHPLYRLTTNGGALVRVGLPQTVLHQVHPGTPLVLLHAGRKIRLSISRVFPTVDARALGYAEADLQAIPFDLPSGSRLGCRVILDQARQGVRIPYGCLLCDQDRISCRLARVVAAKGEERIEIVPVQVILRGRGGISVKGDLHPGDRVVRAQESVLLKLHSGDLVTVVGGKRP